MSVAESKLNPNRIRSRQTHFYSESSYGRSDSEQLLQSMFYEGGLQTTCSTRRRDDGCVYSIERGYEHCRGSLGRKCSDLMRRVCFIRDEESDIRTNHRSRMLSHAKKACHPFLPCQTCRRPLAARAHHKFLHPLQSLPPEIGACP